MDNDKFFSLLIVMAVSTYLIRALPFTLFQGKIRSKRVQAFFDYIPYSVLSAMTFPAILFSTGSVIAAAAGSRRTSGSPAPRARRATSSHGRSPPSRL